MPLFSHLLPTPTTTTSSSKPSSLMASSSSAAAADATKDPPSSPSPPPSSSAPAPPSASAPSAAAAAASPSPSPSPARSPSHLPLPAPPSSASSRRLPPPCWTHEETLALIDSYRDKWYALRRGNLRASHWQEVADAVARRCSRLPQASPKTSVQCRHKVEKLRKRYRAERLRPNPSAWPYFDRMDRMERGPLPISVRPPVPPAASSAAAAAVGEPSSEEDEDEEDEEEERMASNTRSINGILREGNWGFSRVSRNPRSRKRRAFEEEEEEDDDDEEEEEEGMGGRGEALSQLAVVVRMFGEELVRMEKRRMEMLRQVKRDWMEMEAKRAEMVMESQQCLVDTIANAFSSLKKAKKSQDS